MPADPAPDIRGRALFRDDPLAAEWTVIVVGDRFAGGLPKIASKAVAIASTVTG